MKSEKKTQTFEEAMSRLEEIVGLLEDGGADLNDTMKLYTEGAKLAAYCSQKLKKAEQVINKVTEKENGTAATIITKDENKDE